MTERVAIIDLGSNSARLVIMHIYDNSAYNLVYSQKEPVRLGAGLNETGRLQPDAIKRAIDVLKIFAHRCQLFKVDKILAVATAAVRNAGNGRQFLADIRQQTAINLRVISGESEAKLGYTGMINTIDIDNALLFDSGGGSTELTLIHNRRAEKLTSLTFGAVTLTEKFALADQAGETALAAVAAYIMDQLRPYSWLKKLALPLIGIGGTARNIAKMDQRRKNYLYPKVHNYRLSSFAFQDLWRELAKTSLAQRRKFPGLSSERADIIVAGLNIVKCLFDFTGSSQLIVSGCGLREGLFWQYYLSRQNSNHDMISDPLMHSAHNILLSYAGNVGHARHVAGLAAAMFDGWRPLLGLEDRDKTLLTVAALLHDIGITINYYGHPRHSAYLVDNARLFGLTHREQILTSVIAGWHAGPSFKYSRLPPYNEFLDDIDWQKARRLALLLALAESLDATEMGQVRRLTATVGADGARLDLTTAEPALIERQNARQHSKWFKKELGRELIIN